jgi:hypothetical protein
MNLPNAICYVKYFGDFLCTYVYVCTCAFCVNMTVTSAPEGANVQIFKEF